MTLSERIEGCFLGLAVGDALGVPVEFESRDNLRLDPVTGMRGYGTWNQPPGTWSDDSSLTFCTAESLCNGYDIEAIGRLFVRWMTESYWTARNEVFDVGGTTRSSINNLIKGIQPSGATSEESNGNGSLMRIVPASIYFHHLNDEELYQKIKEVSSITHAHSISIEACFAFSKTVQKIISGTYKPGPQHRNIQSSGYVVHTLEASLWCFDTQISFREAVLKAVNLGEDTDTTACVTGALAGLHYGPSAIPGEWLKALARVDDIRALARKFASHESSYPR